jgi:hypothetical protein
MAPERRGKKAMEVRKKPGASGNTGISGKPKIRGVAGSGSITASKIPCEDSERINGG